MTTDVTMALPPLSTYHQHYVSSFGAMEDIKDYVLLSFLQCFQKLIPFFKKWLPMSKTEILLQLLLSIMMMILIL